MSRKALVPIQLPADPVNALEAATKQYVDAAAHYRIALRSTATSTPVSGTAAETTIISPTFDPIITGERIKFRAWGDALNNSGATATLKLLLRYAALTGTLIFDTANNSLAQSTTIRYPWLVELEIEARTPASNNDYIGRYAIGVATANRMGSSVTAMGVNPGMTLDLSAAFQIFLTGLWSSATNTDVRIQGYTIERFV